MRGVAGHPERIGGPALQGLAEANFDGLLARGLAAGIEPGLEFGDADFVGGSGGFDVDAEARGGADGGEGEAGAFEFGEGEGGGLVERRGGQGNRVGDPGAVLEGNAAGTGHGSRIGEYKAKIKRRGPRSCRGEPCFAECVRILTGDANGDQ